MSKAESDSNVAAAVGDDDEPDEWDKRIYSTGCAAENLKMTECFYGKRDWRLCKDEMDTFKRCWKLHQNDKRTDSKDA
ncbi:hypothetical protein LZ554_005293 [Drepanopeziza brunnea f. sp. 'monogermtubi']|nr:hypothetical protein LZ554_005293 [Drepanopeziza brunnea f. sp. 'monogermtubi']